MKEKIEKRLRVLQNTLHRTEDQESQIAQALRKTRNMVVSMQGGIQELEHILESITEPVEIDKSPSPAGLVEAEVTQETKEK